MQEKMDKLTTTAPQIGLRLNTAQITLTRNNHKTEDPINVINGDALEVLEDFAFWPNAITK